MRSSHTIIATTSYNMSYDWSHREYYADDPAHYASPVFNSGGENSDDTIPRKQAPSLRRHSTCRPSTALYLPHKKPKSTFRYSYNRHSYKSFFV
ncbi:hypothetical protein ANCCAN_17983 [Ancylostoma caninum]|uniref:Uncharacterized protein n=1 Tax=Ancylostoma caninum TaxID=29170 RepID=A0A368FVC0_ANCCA|nr:hypothetical protein ANCCAN_17983 [Ancylostoma caninum]